MDGIVIILMEIKEILYKISEIKSSLKKQLYTVRVISKIIQGKGKEPPIIGGSPISYYSSEVYFASDIDLAYSDIESLDKVLIEMGFIKKVGMGFIKIWKLL